MRMSSGQQMSWNKQRLHSQRQQPRETNGAAYLPELQLLSQSFSKFFGNGHVLWSLYKILAVSAKGAQWQRQDTLKN